MLHYLCYISLKNGNDSNHCPYNQEDNENEQAYYVCIFMTLQIPIPIHNWFLMLRNWLYFIFGSTAAHFMVQFIKSILPSQVIEDKW